MMTKSKKELAHKFQCTCCGSFQIHLPVIVYHSANTDHNSYLGLYSKIFPDPFCLFVVRICDAYYCQIVVEFFLDWQWHFIESLPTIHVLVWINTFLQHQNLLVSSLQNLHMFSNLFTKYLPNFSSLFLTISYLRHD